MISRKFVKVIRLGFSVLLFLGLAAGMFYLGVIFQKVQEKGVFAVVREQGVNIVFGVLAGLITAAVIQYLKTIIDNLKFVRKDDSIFSGLWEEYYQPSVFKEQGQEQSLVFKIKHNGENISGTLTGQDNPNCPADQRNGLRLFSVQGHVERNLLSLSAVLDSDDSIGHTVYLLQTNHDCTELDGITIYYDVNEKQLTTAKTKLVKRKKGNLNRI